MNRTSHLLRSVWVAYTAICASVLHAQSVATDPVGAIVIPLSGNSDTLVSLPFHRPSVLETLVQSASGNVISISASANVTANQYVYNGSTQPNTYYVQFLTGNREGMFYTIIANSATNITVDNNGDAGLAGNLSSTDTFQVIPYWTLNTLFPSGQGINQSPSFSIPQRYSEILFPANDTPGINLASTDDYYYYNGSSSGGAGWRKAGSPLTTTFNNTVLYPDSFFVVRNNIAGDTQLTLVGAVPMSAYSTPVSTLAANVSQDVYIGVSVPANVTLSDSKLFETGAFAPSSSFSISQRADQLLVYDYTTTGKNRAATESYYYYNGTASGGAGWRKVGAPLTTIQNNTQVFLPGRGYVIRKIATSTPQTYTWTFVPSYLSPPAE